MDNADVFIDQWSKEYTDEPETSWDDIFGRVLDEFMRYADDEASANEEGYTIQERRDLNMLDDYDIRTEFNEFVRWLDLSDFDTEENINATRGDKNMKKFIKANREMPFGRKPAPKNTVIQSICLAMNPAFFSQSKCEASQPPAYMTGKKRRHK